jgi:hypothetical protein
MVSFRNSTQIIHQSGLVHACDELVDEVLTVTEVTALDEVLELPGVETTSGGGQLEWPKEVAGLLEVGANSVDLMDQVLDADNAELAEVLLDELVVGDGKALLVDHGWSSSWGSRMRRRARRSSASQWWPW